MQKPEARHFFSGKSFAPRNSVKQVDVKNIVFRKPDNRKKPDFGVRELKTLHYTLCDKGNQTNNISNFLLN